MAWSLAFARDPERVAVLTYLDSTESVRWDGTGNTVADGGLVFETPVRQVLASAQFTGPPGQEQDAAEAWAFELKAYFHRGVGEPPVVIYEGGVYTVTGLIQTTHPGDVPGPDGIGVVHMSAEWVHNDEDTQWELRVTWRDEPRQRTETGVISWVTDELITRCADPVMVAASLFSRVGSVPPPLADYLPGYDPDII